MRIQTFEASVRDHAGTWVIDLRGQIDREADAAMNEAYAVATGTDSPIALNFEAVDYINSTGIAVIVGILARARADGKQVSACGLSDHYRQIFEITRLADFMSIYDDENAAIDQIPTE